MTEIYKKSAPAPGRAAVVVAGVRTPFVRSNGVLRKLTTLDLATAVVQELLGRSGVDGKEVDRLVYGQVVPALETPNIAREVVLGTALPAAVDAYSVSRACATSTQAIAEGAAAIEAGEVDVVICGGADSLSKPPISFSDKFVDVAMRAQAARTPAAKLKALAALRLRDLKPKLPAIREYSTGETMGEAAEKMAKLNKVSREAQDALALRSHERAAAAWEQGIYGEEVMAVSVPPEYDEVVARDNLVRADTSAEKLAGLKPVFDRHHGTVTAGNSSALTDGASAVLLMSEEKARALGYRPLAAVRGWAFAGLDPSWQLLLGPALATPRLLKRLAMDLKDVDLIDMHEAFAAQVLSNMGAFRCPHFAREHLGWSKPIGEIDEARLNIYGGSIALGHPFAATGARQVLTMSRELHRRGGGHALVTQCAAGGLGAALMLEGMASSQA